MKRMKVSGAVAAITIFTAATCLTLAQAQAQEFEPVLPGCIGTVEKIENRFFYVVLAKCPEGLLLSSISKHRGINKQHLASQ